MATKIILWDSCASTNAQSLPIKQGVLFDPGTHCSSASKDQDQSSDSAVSSHQRFITSRNIAIFQDTRSDMPAQSAYVLVLLSMVFLYSSMAHPFARKRQEMRAALCESCGNEEQCAECKYGAVYSSLCGVNVCGKGPGEKCGGPGDSIWGECGDGLTCSCNICTGCSLTTYTCEPDMCPPQEKPRPSHITFDIQLYPNQLK